VAGPAPVEVTVGEVLATPAEVGVSVPESTPSFVSVLSSIFVAAKGLRGGLKEIPVRVQRPNTQWQFEPTPALEIPAGSSEPVSHTILFGARADGEPISVPFELESRRSWLTIENPTGLTPASVAIRLDPTQMTSGRNTADLMLRGLSRDTPIFLSFNIGPSLSSIGGNLPDIFLPVGSDPVPFPVQITSTVEPVDFRIRTDGAPWLQAIPASGRTPAEISLYIDPSKIETGKLSRSTYFIESSRAPALGSTVTAAVFEPATFPMRQSVSGTPGGIVKALAAFDCESRSFDPPWPLETDGWVVRIEGRSLPIGAMRRTPLTFPPRFVAGCEISFQLPPEISGDWEAIAEGPGGATRGIWEGKTVALRRMFLDEAKRPVVAHEDGTAVSLSSPARTGELLTVRVGGYGRTIPEAPWGDVAHQPIRPAGAVYAYVGGRTAAIVSAELSAVEVAVMEVRLRVPEIAPDVHPLTVTVAGVALGEARLSVIR